MLMKLSNYALKFITNLGSVERKAAFYGDFPADPF